MSKTNKFSLQLEEELAEVVRLLQDDNGVEEAVQSGEETDTDASESYENMEENREDEDEIYENQDGDDDGRTANAVDGSGDKISEYYIAEQKSKGKVLATWKWQKTPLRVTRKRAQNVTVHLPGVKGYAKHVDGIFSTWNCLIDDYIIYVIVQYTNQYIATVAHRYNRTKDARSTDSIEIKAFIGLLYLAGVYKANRLNLEELWDPNGNGVEKFRLTMSLKRFRFLMRCLRFDDFQTRQERKLQDRLTAIRTVFDHFVDNCQKNYTVGQNVTVGEKLEAFHGKCCFRQYSPKKSARYGIKIYAVVDARVFYTYNLEIYAGNQPEGPYSVSNKPVDVVKRLVNPLRGSGRNIICDNWFSDYILLSDLKNMELSFVGTLKKNKPQIPSIFKSNKNRDTGASLFGFEKEGTLVSYIPKKNNNVILISSIHMDYGLDVSTGDKREPEIISFYNKTKTGVEVVDQMCSMYNVARAAKRWPMVIFYSILNIAGINSQIIYTGNKYKVKSRRAFLRLLSDELVKEQLQRRHASNTGLPKSISDGLKRIIPQPEPSHEQSTSLKRRLCKPCKSNKKKRLTKYSCHVCNAYLCLEHCNMMCGSECNITTCHSDSNDD